MTLYSLFSAAVREVFQDVKIAGSKAYSPYREDSVSVVTLPTGGKQSRRIIALRPDARQYIHDNWSRLSTTPALSRFILSLSKEAHRKRALLQKQLGLPNSLAQTTRRVDDILRNHIANLAYPAGLRLSSARNSFRNPGIYL